MAELPSKQSNRPSNLAELFEDESLRWNHADWVKTLAFELFTLFDAEPLAQVAAKQTLFSTAMIPLLVKVLLTTENAAVSKSLNIGVNRFFSKSFSELLGERMEVSAFL